ncbi:MAG: alkaline phosphatase D family protein, partial [Myxococcales bacterium]|nr:alkaline phosphatase D family protein [Myxococcales bacterium]
HEIDNNFNPEEFDPTRLGYALTAYKEYAPLRVDSEKPNRFWRTQRWGRTLELIILDSRTERLPSKKQYISGEQMEWLKSRLLNTPARFKFIVNTVPIAKFPIDNPDGWSGYDSQRNEILGYIESHEIKHVYWLSGDMHAAMVFDLGAGGWDLVASPIGQLQIGAWDVLSALDEVKYINGNVNNYMLVTADPTHDPPQVRISLRTDDGSEIYSQTFQ